MNRRGFLKRLAGAATLPYFGGENATFVNRTDSGQTVHVDTSTSDVTVTLPDRAFLGKAIKIVNRGEGRVIVEVR